MDCRAAKPGARGRNSLLRGKRTIAIPGKARFEVQPGDVLRIESPGGGGYGSATEPRP